VAAGQPVGNIDGQFPSLHEQNYFTSLDGIV
jgi:hypothetical protein